MSKLTHLDEAGHANMVNVGEKQETQRRAVATGRIFLSPDTLTLLRENGLPKGDVLAVARVAGIMAAKRTSELIPLCHPLMLNKVSLDFTYEETGIAIRAEAWVSGKTGVEMEALTAVSVAALTLYDMVKAVDRKAIISDIRLEEKSGGKSGDFVRE